MRNNGEAGVFEFSRPEPGPRGGAASVSYEESEVRYYSRKMRGRFTRSRGANVWNDEGRCFIDFFASCGALNYGHNHPLIKQSASSYLAEDGILCSLDLATDAKHRFIEKFGRHILAPRKLDYRFQFTGPTGANAIEAALKLARKVTGRTNVVAFTNAFHGMSLGALSATGSQFARRGAGMPLHNIIRLPFDGYHGATVKDLVRFEAMVNDPSGGIDAPAAFILETIQGEGGLNVASVVWLRSLAGLAKRLGALFIVDEVQSGCGRTGTFFSFERAGLTPDIVCLAKSISGLGLPMALVLLKPELDIWQPGEHNGTFRGNNLAFVTGAAAAELWSDKSFLERVDENSRIIADWLTRIVETYGREVLSPCGIGMMSGLRFSDPKVAHAVLANAFARNVLLEASGPRDEVVKLMPPLTISATELQEGLHRIANAIADEQRHAPDQIAAE